MSHSAERNMQIIHNYYQARDAVDAATKEGLNSEQLAVLRLASHYATEELLSAARELSEK